MALTDSLISYWKLEETSGTRVDSHGTNDLTDNNTVTSATGKINTAASFANASNEYLSHTDNTDLSLGDIDWTIAGWVNLATKSAIRRIFCKGNVSGQFAYNIDYFSTSDRFRFENSGDGGFGASFSSVLANNLGSPSTSTWYYIVCWHDSVGNTINIQVNNGTANSTAHSSGTFDDSQTFGIGGNDAMLIGERFDGQIDEVGFWKRVLTADERTSLYNGGSGLAYPFSSGVGGTPLRNRVMTPGHIFGGKCLC